MTAPTKKSILLVDDDKFLLDMYAQKFTKSNWAVEVVCGSEAALKRLREGTAPDVILLDIIMPTIDGIEMLGIMRKEKLASTSTVIMLTNQSQSSDIDKAKDLKVDGYIIKATSIPSEVLEKVEEIYNKKHK
jgi:two-component system, OmpR family, response regulator MtrA